MSEDKKIRDYRKKYRANNYTGVHETFCSVCGRHLKMFKGVIKDPCRTCRDKRKKEKDL